MNSFLKQNSDGSVQLCCGSVNCPTVEKITDDKLVITDDDGNKIVVSAGQAKLISDAATMLQQESKKNDLLLG